LQDKEGDVSQGIDPQTAQLIEENLPLVRHVVYQVSAHFPRHVDKEELVRAGVLGLVEAAHRFDPAKGIPFPPYASQRIRGANLDAVRKVDWAPRSLRRAGRTLDATADRLANDLHRNPTTVELAAALRTSVEEVAELQRNLLRSVVLGLDVIVSETSADGGDDVVLEGTVADDTPSVEDELCDREMGAYLRDAVALLPERHRIVVQGYFFDGRTSEELAGELGITVSRVSQIRTEAFDMLRQGLTAQYEGDADATATGTSPRRVRQNQAYAAAIAARSTWRSRLDVVGSEPGRRLEQAV
jgi:RNA polymerase sigma factor for flagellar operon FliA